MPTATFKQIPSDLANKLLAFVDRRNLGKSTDIDGISYTLDHISQNSSKFWKSRGLSVYFRAGRSVIRISDHWSKSTGNDRSRKLNCGFIGDCQWFIDNDGGAPLTLDKYAGKFPWKMLAGKCSLATLNKTCDHWID